VPAPPLIEAHPMAQTLKPEVRRGILAAAAAAFMQAGYRGARLQDIARACGVATGNLYRYYRDKDDLFAAIVPRSVAARLLRLIRARVRELAAGSDWPAMTLGGSQRADALLEFFIEQHDAVLILLDGAEGSPLGHVRGLVVRELTRLSATYLGRHEPGPQAVVPQVVLLQIFTNTVDMIVAILRESPRPSAIRAAFAAFWRYQLAGLQALLQPAAGMNKGR
jgi:AcrR family transcriptional regulator